MVNSIIIVSETSDHSTSKVIRWLNYLNYHKTVRLNIDDDFFKVLSLSETDAIVSSSFGEHKIRKNDIVWFRRTANKKVHLIDRTPKPIDLNFQLKLFNQIEKEDVIESFYHWVLNNCKSIGIPFKSSVSKINTLILAKKLGIAVPKWLLTNSKQELENFIESNKTIVQKTFNHFYFHDSVKNESHYIFAKLVNDIEQRPNCFDTSFFQEYIDKKYEIRAFFWDNKFYSMGIFSQNDTKTKIDFRDYNLKKPNRRVPIDLPTGLSIKLEKLMNQLGLETGSIDILVTKDNSYYFLEVNPIGQFGMVSYPCNYQIEKIIAKSLIKKYNEVTHHKKKRN